MENVLESNGRIEKSVQSVSARKQMLAGIITGQVAGLIMAVVVMFVFAVFLGKNFLFPVQVIGSMAFGESALQGLNFGAILAGLIFHQLGPALLWGFVFGLFAKKFSIETVGTAIKFGVGLGVIAMVGPYLLIPTLMKALHGVDIWGREVPIFWDWAAHLVFGISFAFYPMIQAKVGSRALN